MLRLYRLIVSGLLLSLFSTNGWPDDSRLRQIFEGDPIVTEDEMTQNQSAAVAKLDRQIAATGMRILKLHAEANRMAHILQLKPNGIHTIRAEQIEPELHREEDNLVKLMLVCNSTAYSRFASLSEQIQKEIILRGIVETVIDAPVCQSRGTCICGIDYDGTIEDDPFGDALLILDLVSLILSLASTGQATIKAGTYGMLRAYWWIRSHVAVSLAANPMVQQVVRRAGRDIAVDFSVARARGGLGLGDLGEAGSISAVKQRLRNRVSGEGGIITQLEEAVATDGRKLDDLASDVVEGADAGRYFDLVEAQQARKEIEAKLAKISEVGGSATLAARRSVPFRSYRAFLEVFHSAGRNRHWHHIVERNVAVLKKWQQTHLVHSEINLIRLPKGLHARLSGFYSCKQHRFTNGLSVRDWLMTRCESNFDCYYVWGLKFTWQVLTDALPACVKM